MSVKASAGSSLIFYTGKNYAGSAQQVTHGVTGMLAGGSAAWSYQSVALSAMESYVFSTVNTADASVNYLGHVEAVISVSQTDLTLLYPSSDQFPLNYLGLDPAQAAVVWLDVNAMQAVPNAVASTALPGGGITSLTTLSLPGRRGALGFVAKTEGSSVVASCRYGDYDTANGTVAWRGIGTLILEYTGGIVMLINGGGFPAGWTFSAPQLQGDGSWAVTLEGGVPASDTISSVTANPASIMNDGVSSSVITATVLNGSGQPDSGVTVTWATTLGTVMPGSSVTDVNGLANTTLTDSGTPGTATVTASITDSSKSVDVTVTDSTAGDVITSLTSDKSSIVNDGVDVAMLTATVKDSGGKVVEGVAVYWTTTPGTLNHAEQDTGNNGESKAKLTDTGDTGKAVVTASLDNGKQFSYTVTLTEAHGLNIYCSSGSPLNIGMLAAVQPTNKMALYGPPSATVQLTVTGNAKFKSSGTQSASITLDSTGYGLAEVYDTVGETVTASATLSGTSASGTMTFMATSDKGAVYVNTQTPADNKTPGTFYWWDYEGASVSAVQLSVSGNAHFSDGTKSGSFPLNTSGGAVAVDIYDAIAETVSATLSPESPYYVSSTENINFISYQTGWE